MTDADDFFESPGKANELEPPRDRWGNYLLPDPSDNTGRATGRTRATTLAKTIEDTYHLGKWSNRMVAKGLALRPDLFALAAATPLEDKKVLDEVAEKAKEAAGAGAGANLGTALHAFTETLDSGGDLSTIPEQFRDDVRAYDALLKDRGITVLPKFIERVVLNEDFGVAGRFDRIFQLADGTLVIGDLKTQKTLDFGAGAIAIQLAVYANAKWMRDYEAARYEPMPPVSLDFALVIHLPVGEATATVHRVDLRAGYWGARIAAQGREYNKLSTLITPYRPGFEAQFVSAAVAPTQGSIADAVDLADAIDATVDGDTHYFEGGGADETAEFNSPKPDERLVTDARGNVDKTKSNDPDVLATLSKPVLQALIRQIDPRANVAKHRRPLAELLISLREEINEQDGIQTDPPISPAAEAAHIAEQERDPESASYNPDAIPPLSDAVKEVLAEVETPDNSLAATQAAMQRAREAGKVTTPAPVVNPFATPDNPFEEETAPENPRTAMEARFRSAANKAELAALWNEALAAGVGDQAMMKVGADRMKELYNQQNGG